MRRPALFTYISAILCVHNATVNAQELLPDDYGMGEHTYLEYYVSPSGDDDNSGTSAEDAFRTLTAAYQSIPKNTTLTQPIRITLSTGTYPESSLPNFWEDIVGTASHPLVLRSADGPGTVVLGGDINALNLNYVYFIDLNIVPDPAGDTFHCERCNHILLKRMTLTGGDTSNGAHETLKINQSQHIYIEDSDISGADDNAIDYVAVQYGHILRTRIRRAADWCIYVKGGSAQLTIAGNTISDCGTGGFTAGQGTGFEFMETPWLHYEAYDIRFVNNVIHDTEGAGMGVNGGYNVTLAFNSLYRVGSRSHMLEVYRGRRGCDGDTTTCAAHAALGGWGGSVVEEQVIPNRNVFIYNNLFYNPADFSSGGQFLTVHPPQSSLPGFQNISFPAVADENLQIRGNVFWSPPVSQPIGVEDSSACEAENPTCNVAQLLADNQFNETEPALLDAAAGDLRPAIGSSLLTATGYTIPTYSGGDAPTTPALPAGELGNTVPTDRGGVSRSGSEVPGAYLSADSPLGTVGPTGTISGSAPEISALSGRIRRDRSRRGRAIVRVSTTVTDSDGDIASVQARISSPNGRVVKSKALSLRSGVYTGSMKMKRFRRYDVIITARDGELNTATYSGSIP